MKTKIRKPNKYQRRILKIFSENGYEFIRGNSHYIFKNPITGDMKIIYSSPNNENYLNGLDKKLKKNNLTIVT